MRKFSTSYPEEIHAAVVVQVHWGYYCILNADLDQNFGVFFIKVTKMATYMYEERMI